MLCISHLQKCVCHAMRWLYYGFPDCCCFHCHASIPLWILHPVDRRNNVLTVEQTWTGARTLLMLINNTTNITLRCQPQTSFKYQPPHKHHVGAVPTTAHPSLPHWSSSCGPWMVGQACSIPTAVIDYPQNSNA